MKQLITAAGGPELGLLRNMLQDAGILCDLRNEQLSQVLPSAPFDAELWIENDDDYWMAQDLSEAWFHPPSGPTGSWTCARCGQHVGTRFDSCWKCGTKRAPAAKINNKGKSDENVSRSVD
jgi:hypothetical protein